VEDQQHNDYRQGEHHGDNRDRSDCSRSHVTTLQVLPQPWPLSTRLPEQYRPRARGRGVAVFQIGRRSLLGVTARPGTVTAPVRGRDGRIGWVEPWARRARTAVYWARRHGARKFCSTTPQVPATTGAGVAIFRSPRGRVDGGDADDAAAGGDRAPVRGRIRRFGDASSAGAGPFMPAAGADRFRLHPTSTPI